jgi:DNA-binding NarL/FixJ family response regulator
VTRFAARVWPHRTEDVDVLDAVPELTQIQRALLDELVRGATNFEMATRLGVQPSTVDDHLRQLYAKLGARPRFPAARRAHAVHRAWLLGLVGRTVDETGKSPTP